MKVFKKIWCVFSTSDQRELFCAQCADPETYDDVAKLETIARGGYSDDLIIDDNHLEGPVAYLMTLRGNTVIKMPLALGTVKVVNKPTEIIVQKSA